MKLFELRKEYCDELTAEMAYSIFMEISCASNAGFLIKNGFFKKTLKEVFISEDNSFKYFKAARKGGDFVLLFDNFYPVIVEKYYFESKLEIIKNFINIEEFLKGKIKKKEGGWVVVFLHDFEDLLLF